MKSTKKEAVSLNTASF